MVFVSDLEVLGFYMIEASTQVPLYLSLCSSAEGKTVLFLGFSGNFPHISFLDYDSCLIEFPNLYFVSSRHSKYIKLHDSACEGNGINPYCLTVRP